VSVDAAGAVRVFPPGSTTAAPASRTPVPAGRVSSRDRCWRRRPNGRAFARPAVARPPHLQSGEHARAAGEPKESRAERLSRCPRSGSASMRR